MAEIQIAWLELMTVGGLGVILVLLGVIFNIIVKRQNKLCTKKTDGIVKQYGFPGNGRVYPIVEYFVNGTCYKAKKKFRGIITTQLSGVPVPMKSEVYEDEKGWLHVKTGAIANLRQFAEQLWPINSKMTVKAIEFYNKAEENGFISWYIVIDPSNWSSTIYFHDVYHNGDSNNTLECTGILFDAVINCKR